MNMVQLMKWLDIGYAHRRGFSAGVHKRHGSAFFSIGRVGREFVVALCTLPPPEAVAFSIPEFMVRASYVGTLPDVRDAHGSGKTGPGIDVNTLEMRAAQM